MDLMLLKVFAISRVLQVFSNGPTDSGLQSCVHATKSKILKRISIIHDPKKIHSLRALLDVPNLNALYTI